ncbi:MAG: response regulator [Planctomycetes bacterium]|nr:response regulator [Planctomycetota bacterium]
MVLLGIWMPDYNGLHLCTAIRMKPGMDDIRVIFPTGEHVREDETQRGTKMGAVDYICKPVDGATLRQRVRTVVEHCPNRPAGMGKRSGTSHDQVRTP